LSINAINLSKVIVVEQVVETMVKMRLQVTVREDIVKWVDNEVEKLRFASRSHAIEYALLQLMEKKKKE